MCEHVDLCAFMSPGCYNRKKGPGKFEPQLHGGLHGVCELADLCAFKHLRLGFAVQAWYPKWSGVCWKSMKALMDFQEILRMYFKQVSQSNEGGNFDGG